MSHITSADVSRASHCHHTPHAFRPHSGPVMSPMSPNTTDSSAPATAIRSKTLRPPNRKIALAMPQTDAARNIAIHEGTWK